MSEVLKQPALAGAPELKFGPSSLKAYGPAAPAVDGALMMLALASYMIAAVFYLLNIYAPAQVYQRIGLWGATAGVVFNLSSWLVRWYAAYDAETSVLASQGVTPDKYPWVFRYIPFANLYDLSLAFAFGAGITTLLIGHRKSFR